MTSCLKYAMMSLPLSFSLSLSLSLSLLSLSLFSLSSLSSFSYTEGHDVLMISEEEDKVIIVAGTFEKLVEQLACEERPGQLVLTDG